MSDNVKKFIEGLENGAKLMEEKVDALLTEMHEHEKFVDAELPKLTDAEQDEAYDIMNKECPAITSSKAKFDTLREMIQ